MVNENNPEMKCGYYERMKPEGEDYLFEDILFLRNIYFAPGAYMVRSEELLEVLPDREIYIWKRWTKCTGTVADGVQLQMRIYG